ncbi:RNA-directed DNA polymerase, eukaryota [Tanacetum coccineum]
MKRSIDDVSNTMFHANKKPALRSDPYRLREQRIKEDKYYVKKRISREKDRRIDQKQAKKRERQKEVESVKIPRPMRSRVESKLSNELLKATHSPTQMAAIPLVLQHHDVVGVAETGSAMQFDNASAAKQDLRQAYEKCNDIPQETRNLIDAFLKRESDKDYEINLAMYRKAGKIEKQIEAKYVWLSENTNSFHSPTINTNSFHNFFSHIQTTFQKLTMSETNQSNPSAPEKPTEPILQQPYTTPNHDSETHKGGSSSEQNTHKPTSPITHGFLTEKEYQQLLQDEEVLRETLEEQARAEKEWEDRIKKEEAERGVLVRVESGLPPPLQSTVKSLSGVLDAIDTDVIDEELAKTGCTLEVIHSLLVIYNKVYRKAKPKRPARNRIVTG